MPEYGGGAGFGNLQPVAGGTDRRSTREIVTTFRFRAGAGGGGNPSDRTSYTNLAVTRITPQNP